MIIRQLRPMLLAAMLLAALGVSAQSAKQRVTLKMSDVTLSELLFRLQETTGYDIDYDSESRVIAEHVKTSVNVTDAPLDVVLRIVLMEHQLLSEVDARTIHIKKVNFSTGGTSYKRVLRGMVTDEHGEVITGATISLRGTKIATISDFDGNFSIDIPDMSRPTIVVSYLGMEPQTINVANKIAVVVKLAEDNTTLSDVVVTGYQRIRRSDMVGSNTMFRGKDLDLLGTNSLEQMLQGKMAGTVVLNQSGVVGQRQKVRVRGTSTLLGSQEPVWVVDGVIQTDPLPFKQQELNSLGDISEDNMDMIRNFVGSAISWLDPNDIDNITVLKDASATVLYGVKAANGVIVITTKRGTKGRLSVGYHGGFSVGERISYDKMNLMDSRERNDVSREIYERRLTSQRALEPVGYEGLLKRYLNREMSYDEFSAAAKQLDTQNTDWFDLLYRNPLSHNHSVSISGGSDMLSYYGSVSANINNGTQIGNQSDRYSASLRLSNQIGRHVQLSMNLAGSTGRTESFSSYVNPYSYASKTSRVIPAYNADGSLYYYPYQTFGYLFNVLNELDQSGNENENRSLNMSAHLQWDITDGLRFESTFGLSTSNTAGSTWASERTYAMTRERGYEFGRYSPADAEYRASRLPHGGQYSSTESRSLSYTWTNQLAYNTVLGKDHRVSLLVGEEIRSEKYDGENAVRYGYLPDRGKTFATPPLIVESGENQYSNYLYNRMTTQVTDRKSNYLGLYASASYSYKERYTATASFRTDASNRFGQDTRNRFLPVWSLGGRWNVINEEWMARQRLVSDLALRVTYGWQGNAVENYGPNLIAQIPQNAVDNRTGEYMLKIRSLAYPDLRWEKTETWNLGVDLGFWHNRVQIGFEYYYKKTTDMIVQQPVPMEYGVATTPVNGGSMVNKGAELSLNTTLVQGKKLNWNLSLNWAKNFNEIQSTMNENQNWRTAVSGALNKEGYPVQSIWAFEFAGINQTNGDPMFVVPTPEENPAAVTDATAWMKYMGSLEPDFTGGLSTTLRYTNVALSASFNLNLGGKRFLAPMFSDDIVIDVPSAYNNLPKDFVDHWRQPGDVTDVPGIPSRDVQRRSVSLPSGLTEYSYRMYNYADIRVVSGSYLRCNNISLSYFFPQKAIAPWGLHNLSCSLSVSSPFIIKSRDYKGLDPEVATGSQPITRTYSFNVNISL